MLQVYHLLHNFVFFPCLDQDAAATKLQALQRKKSSAPAGAEGNMGGGGSLEDVFKAFCATYRQETMTNTVFVRLSAESQRGRRLTSVPLV